MNSGPTWIDIPSGIMNVPLSAELMLRMARGFLLLFWSIPIATALARGVVQIPLVTQLQMPSYVIGLCIAYIGVLYLRRGGALTAHWMRRVHDMTALLLIQVYLSPFSRWWVISPQSAYYMVNMLAIVVVAAWLFYTVNMLGAEWARVVHNTEFRIESELAAWISLITALLPALTVLADTLAAHTLGSDTIAPADWFIGRWVRWLDFLHPFPFILTALVLWKARRLALRRCTSGIARTDKPTS